MDVSHFKPEELSVKMTDNFITVEGKHEEKENEKNFVSRNFVSKFSLPSGVKADSVKCDLSSDHVLIISAPKPAAIENKPAGEKVLSITHSR